MGLPPHAFTSQVRAILDAPEEMVDVLATLDVPTLVVVGNQDILTPRGDSEELAERIPGAELVVISGAAHGLMIEHATTFNRVVLDFLTRVAGEQAAA
jgi:3-oxoadipate enol-lactonase